jgi:hypothetical protein
MTPESNSPEDQEIAAPAASSYAHAYYTMAFVGMAPFGSLLAGALAHWIGAPHTVIVSGVACIIGALWFWTRLGAIRKQMRPIYERLGIVPQRNVPIEQSAES